MSAPTTVGIDNNFPAGQTSVSLGPPDDEEAGWLNLYRLVSIYPKGVGREGVRFQSAFLHGTSFVRLASEQE
jgi:hypothetical protein